MDVEHGFSLTCILGALLGIACSAPSRQETGGLFWAGVADGGPWLIYLRPGSEATGMMVDTQPLDLRRIATTLSSAGQSASGAYAKAGTRERNGVEVVLVDAPGRYAGQIGGTVRATGRT